MDQKFQQGIQFLDWFLIKNFTKILEKITVLGVFDEKFSESFREATIFKTTSGKNILKNGLLKIFTTESILR